MKDETFYENLFAAKKELQHLKLTKDNKVQFKQTKYSFFDINQLLEVVEPILFKHGMMVLQPIEEDCVVTKIIDDKGFGIASAMKMIMLGDPQKMGSQITYFRRYTLQSLLSLQSEDDDGQKAVKQVVQDSKPNLNVYRPNTEVPTPQWNNILEGIKKGTVKSVDDVKKHFKMDKVTEGALILALKL